jgi:hypothetical protein
VQRGRILLALLFVACGPSVDGPIEPSTGSGSSSATTADASASASSASGGLETSSSSGDASSGADETGVTPTDLPPEAAGEWVCSGWEDPLYIDLQLTPPTVWEGTACAPYSTRPGPIEPSCDALGFDHANLTNTQAYWIFELDYTDAGLGVLAIDMGMSYVPETDTLEGFLFLNGGAPIPETCERLMR